MPINLGLFFLDDPCLGFPQATYLISPPPGPMMRPLALIRFFIIPCYTELIFLFCPILRILVCPVVNVSRRQARPPWEIRGRVVKSSYPTAFLLLVTPSLSLSLSVWFFFFLFSLSTTVSFLHPFCFHKFGIRGVSMTYFSAPVLMRSCSKDLTSFPELLN